MHKLLSFLFVLFASTLFAQDTLVRIDSTRIVVTVKEISDKKIRYVRYSYPDGPVYEVSRVHVARIRYADGTQEVYGRNAEEALNGGRRNVLALTTSDIISGLGTVYYERKFGTDMGIRFIYSMGFLGVSGEIPDYSGNYYYNRFKLFSGGIDVHYYAYQGSRFSYYIGSLIEIGRTRQRDYWYDFPYPYPYPTSQISDYAFIGITNGMTIHSSKAMNIDLFTSLGWTNEFNNGGSDLAARLGLSVGYRF